MRTRSCLLRGTNCWHVVFLLRSWRRLVTDSIASSRFSKLTQFFPQSSPRQTLEAMRIVGVVGLGFSLCAQQSAGQDGSNVAAHSFTDLDNSTDLANSLATLNELAGAVSGAKSIGLKLKFFYKVDLSGKKLVVKTDNDVCYNVAPCFDNMATSLSWTKAPGPGSYIELFESGGCRDNSVLISDLGPLGASGNVTALKTYKFNNKMSSFIVRSGPGIETIQNHVDACPVADTSGSGSSGDDSGSSDVGDEDVSRPVPGSLKVKLFNKVDLAGKKLVVKTDSDVCYNVAPCFDNLATSLEWSKVSDVLKAIDLFEAADCSGSNVSITDLGPVGGGGNVSALKTLKFNNKLSSFVVRSVNGVSSNPRVADACALEESIDTSGESSGDGATQTPTISPGPTPIAPIPAPISTPSSEPTFSSSPIPTAQNTASATPVSSTETPLPSKASGLKVKLFNKPDLAGKKLVIMTVNDVCYSVDACFDDMTTSVEWTKIPSSGLTLEFFESSGCLNASITLPELGVIGGSGNVTTLKTYKFNNKVSSFVVRSVPAAARPEIQVDACVDNTVTRLV